MHELKRRNLSSGGASFAVRKQLPDVIVLAQLQL